MQQFFLGTMSWPVPSQEYSSNEGENEDEDTSGLADELTAEDLSRQEDTGARSIIEVGLYCFCALLSVEIRVRHAPGSISICH